MRRLAFLALPALLAGCAQFSADGGMGEVASGVRQEIGKDVVKISTDEQAARAREQVTALLAGPLSAEQAVQIALLNTRTLQAAQGGWTSGVPKSGVFVISDTSPPAPAIEQRESDEEGPNCRASPLVIARSQTITEAGKRSGCSKGEPDAADDLGNDQRA